MTVDLFSRVIGEGEPLIILHGLFGMGDNWQTLGKKWAEQGYAVHIIDQRNHGQTENTEDFSYQLMSDDLLAYLDQHGLDKVSILGHSMGGKVAMLFATQHPERVNKLMIVDIAPKGYPVHHNEIIAGLKTLDFSILTSRREADAELAKSLPNMAIRQFLLKSLYWVEKGQLGLRFNLDSISKHIEMVGEALLPEATFDGPTTFIRGANSGYIVDGDMDLIRHHFPAAQLVTAPGAGHWVHAENPQLVYDETCKLLKS